MGIFNKKNEIKNETSSIDKSIQKLMNYFRGQELIIDKDTAFKVAAAYQAVNVISSQIALLPCPVYKIEKNGTKEKDKTNNLYKLLNIQFNEYTTAYKGWQIFMANCLLSSAGYIYIERKNGIPVALYPINSYRVTKSINEKTLKPKYTITFPNDNSVVVKYTDMIEVQGLTDDIHDPKDPIELLKNVLAISMQAEAFGKEYFENGIHPTGIFSMDGHLETERAKEFKEEVKNLYSGLGKRHKAMLLEDGLKFNKITVNPEEGQMSETRNFQVLEIARFFNIPPTKLFQLDRATWSNLEELNIQFVQETLAPWIVAIQQTLNMQLLMEEQKDKYFIEFNLGGLLRGKMADRYESYAKGRQWGFLSVNEIRELENMSNIGEQGNIYLTPVNMTDSKQIKENGGSENA